MTNELPTTETRIANTKAALAAARAEIQHLITCQRAGAVSYGRYSWDERIAQQRQLYRDLSDLLYELDMIAVNENVRDTFENPRLSESGFPAN